jgi:uncharacterized protein
MSRSAILVFAKPAEPGRVKTRLLGVLSAQQAASVHRACLEDMVRQVSRLPGCEPCLRVAGRPDMARELAAALRLDGRWRVGVQRGRDLGERLQEAFAAAFRAGCGKVVAVGTDTPWMGNQRILQALRLLDKTDVVLGPCADGGYYLAGARRLVPQMFQQIPWGRAQVFDTTLRAVQKARASYRLLPRDFDLDRPEDLERAAQVLRRNANRAPQLAEWVNQLREEPVSRSSRRRPPARRRKTRRPGRA